MLVKIYSKHIISNGNPHQQDNSMFGDTGIISTSSSPQEILVSLFEYIVQNLICTITSISTKFPTLCRQQGQYKHALY